MLVTSIFSFSPNVFKRFLIQSRLTSGLCCKELMYSVFHLLIHSFTHPFIPSFQLQQLAESGEESIVLTANVLEGTADHLGSVRGAGFLEDQEQLQKQFLNYCTGW